MFRSKFASLLVGFSFCFLLSENSLAQAKLVLNGAKINVSAGASLVVANPAPDALIRKSGHIISEGENNQVIWHTGNTAGTYVVPFGVGASEYIPVTFTKTAGTGNGAFNFATFGTNWQNSATLPAGISNVNRNGADNSAMVIDRFWKIAPQDYTQNPELSNLAFSYLATEMASPNTITDGLLQAQFWNETTQTWSAAMGQAEISGQQVTIPLISAGSNYKWWTLADGSSPLPLEMINFEARLSGKKVKLNWLTAQEINCQDFEIQRSPDSKNYTVIGKVMARNGNLNTYEFFDQSPLPGTSYYRLKQNDTDSNFTYSPIKAVNSMQASSLSIYPNPVKSKKLNLVLGNEPAGLYSIQVSTANGATIYKTELTLTSNPQIIHLPASLPPGLYLLSVQSNRLYKQFKINVQ